MDSASSAFLLSMYRAARHMPHAEFRAWVFAELGRHLRFDSGIWLRVSMTESGPLLHDQYLDRQRPDRLTGYLVDGLWRDDPFMHSVMGNPGRAAILSASDIPSARLRAFLARHEQAHVVTWLDVNDASGVFLGLSIFRRSAADPFDEGDRQFLDWVGPHIVDAWTHNWLQQLEAEANNGGARASGYAQAVLTANRMLTAADDRFAQLLRCEWPDWRGPSLPAALDEQTRKLVPGSWSHKGLVFRFRPLRDGLTLVQLRARHALDALAPRKREVASMFAQGVSQVQVAQRVGLSVSTVNNYLVEIYRHLNVSDKAQFALVVSRLPE